MAEMFILRNSFISSSGQLLLVIAIFFVVGIGGRRVGGSDDFDLFGVSRVVEHVGEESAAGRAGRLSPRDEPGRARRYAEELAVGRPVLPVGKRVDERVDDTGLQDRMEAITWMTGTFVFFYGIKKLKKERNGASARERRPDFPSSSKFPFFLKLKFFILNHSKRA
jgi:hypothetical protein